MSGIIIKGNMGKGPLENIQLVDDAYIQNREDENEVGDEQEPEDE